ncbi:MAG: aminoglycoside phosphotransferase family protein [Pseudomonadota bacterium]
MNQIVPLGSRWNNDNFVVTMQELYGETKYLLRLTRGGGFGLMARIAYEFGVLQTVRQSGITPRPFFCDEAAMVDGQSAGALLMEFLTGQPLVCDTHWWLAAQTLGLIHSLPAHGRLVEREEPVMDVYGMFDGITTMDTQAHGAELSRLAQRAARLLAGEERVVTHGSVQPSDFVVDEDRGRAWLVDWENGGMSTRWVDVGLFMASAAMVPVGAYCRTDDERREFLDAYALAAGVSMPMEDMLARAAVFERVCELRTEIAKGRPDPDG